MLYKFRVKVSTLFHFCMKILKTSIFVQKVVLQRLEKVVLHTLLIISVTPKSAIFGLGDHWSKLSIDTPPSDFFQMLYYKDFKGYLHYKTLTSQNLSSEAQVKTFLFRRKIIFHSQDIHVFAFLTIP